MMTTKPIDLEIVLPVCGEAHWGQRLANFKRYGLLNPGSYQIRLVLLVYAWEQISGLEKDWPEGYEVEICNCTNDQISAKVCFYYMEWLAKRIEKYPSRWYARVDDDSVTDVSGLIDNLDKWYDYKEKFYLATSLVPGQYDIDLNCGVEEAEALRISGQHHLILERDHEWESCFVSLAAMRRILNDQKAMAYIKQRSLIESGTGDRFFGPAAKIAKVYPMNCPFTTKDAVCNEFSYIGGKYNHIHYIAQDINEDQYLAFTSALNNIFAMKNNFTDTESDLYKKLVQEEYAFYSNNNFLGILTLSPICHIANYNNPNEFLWKVRNNTLEFISNHGKTSSVYPDITDIDYITGKFVLGEHEAVHILRRVCGPPKKPHSDIVVTDKLSAQSVA
jgi:hypothetical protein